MVLELKVIYGGVRDLTDEERRGYPGYTYVTTSPSIFKYGKLTLTVPVGFLTDGATGAPDYGRSWLFHDFLYCTHEFDDGVKCSRRVADQVMHLVLQNERIWWYGKLFCYAAKKNVFGFFSRAWRRGIIRGPEFIEK